jgi:hypothetical protein
MDVNAALMNYLEAPSIREIAAFEPKKRGKVI